MVVLVFGLESIEVTKYCGSRGLFSISVLVVVSFEFMLSWFQIAVWLVSIIAGLVFRLNNKDSWFERK